MTLADAKMAGQSVRSSLKISRFLTNNSSIFQSSGLNRCHGSLFRSYSSTEAKPEKSTDGGDGSSSEDESQLKSVVEKLNLQLKESTDKYNALDDKYKRALAESENMRRRLTKQIEDAKIFSIQGFCKDLLEVSDILQRATESVPKDAVTADNPHLKSLYEGLTMTEAQLQGVFRRHGLAAVNPIDEKFNPNFHEALFQQEVQGKEPGTVVVVSKIGYKLHERVIRPALVGVAKGS